MQEAVFDAHTQEVKDPLCAGEKERSVVTHCWRRWDPPSPADTGTQSPWKPCGRYHRWHKDWKCRHARLMEASGIKGWGGGGGRGVKQQQQFSGFSSSSQSSIYNFIFKLTCSHCLFNLTNSPKLICSSATKYDIKSN